MDLSRVMEAIAVPTKMSRTRLTMHLPEYGMDVEVVLADLRPPPLTVQNDLAKRRLMVAFDNPDNVRR